MGAVIELALFSLLAAATSVGAIEAIRKAPVISRWNEEGVRPWACDLCMSFWGTLTVCLLVILVPEDGRGEALLGWLPSFALAYTWLTRITPLPDPGPGPGLPALPEEEE